MFIGPEALDTEDHPQGLPADIMDKLRKMLAFMQEIQSAEVLRSIHVWKAYLRTGGRTGTWSPHH